MSGAGRWARGVRGGRGRARNHSYNPIRTIHLPVLAHMSYGMPGPASQSTFALFSAAETNCVDRVQALLADGHADPAWDDSSALRAAAAFGHAAVVAALLADGRADPTEDLSAPLRLAAGFGHADVVKTLLGDGRIDPTAFDFAALREAVFCACRTGGTGPLRALLDDGRLDPRGGEAYEGVARARAHARAWQLPWIESADVCLQRWWRSQRRRQWLRASAPLSKPV